MAGTRSRRSFRKPNVKGNSLSDIRVTDYSKGYDSYTANDAMKPDVLRFAQDSRISTRGRMTTRKGSNFYSDALGETADDDQTSVTGAADQEVGTAGWRADKFTTTTAGRLTKVELNLKSNTGTAPIIVRVYTDSSGEPGTLIATSSIKSSDLTGTYAYLPARFVDAPLLTTATAYWIVVSQQEEGSGSFYWSSTTTTTTALSSANSGGTWSSTSYSTNLKTYLSTDSPVKGLFRAYKSNATKATLMASSTILSSVSDVDGSLTSIKTGLSGTATHYRFANINDEVFYVNGVDTPRKWDFTTDAEMEWGVSGGSSAPVANLIVAHQDLIFMNDTTDPTRIEFSDEDSYEAAASTNFYYVPSPRSPAPIVALVALNGVLHHFTTDKKFSLYGTDKATFQLVEAPAKKGTFSQESVVATRNNIFFMSDDGVYAFNGVEDTLISQDITDTIEGMTNKDSVVLSVNGNRLIMHYTDSGSPENDKSIVYNLDYGSWESQDTNQYVAHTSQWEGGSDSFEYTVGSSRCGQVFKFDENDNDYSDAGKPLNFEIRTHYFFGDEPNAKKIFKRWYPRFIKQTRSYTVNCEVDINFVDSPTTYTVDTGATGTTWGGGATWGDGSVYGSSSFASDRIHVSGQSYYQQYRIRKSGVNTPVEFTGHTFQIQKKRTR